jgi:hypothetical protein
MAKRKITLPLLGIEPGSSSTLPRYINEVLTLNCMAVKLGLLHYGKGKD